MNCTRQLYKAEPDVVDRKADRQGQTGGEPRQVLVLDQSRAVADAVVHLLRTHGSAVERVASELDAFQRLAALPTVRTLVIAGAGGAGGAVAHFARRVVPGIVVITLNAESAEAGVGAAFLPA